MAEYYSLLPQDPKQSEEVASSDARIREVRGVCENVEMDQCNAKLNDAQVQAYHFQLLIYLVQDELSLAKYLFKRVPKEVREKESFKAIWDVGCSQWKSQHNEVYAKIKNGKWAPILKPLFGRLAVNYRAKQVELVSKSYTSITIKELLGSYLGLKDAKELKKFINDNQLNDVWSLDNEQKPTKVIISKRQENYEELLDATRLMSQFTKYVCFMESQQKLAIDEISAAANQKN
eukprot:691344_1